MARARSGYRCVNGGIEVVLKTRRWGPAGARGFVCVHGVSQHGGVFEGLGERLAAAGTRSSPSTCAVTASRAASRLGTRHPVADLLETLDAAGVERVDLDRAQLRRSAGGRSRGRALAQRGDRLVLLDPGLEVARARALRSAEIDRLDWSFATTDGALNALLSSDAVVAAPREVVAAYVHDDVRKGPDGRYRFSFCPSAAVVAWSEMTLPPPPIAADADARRPRRGTAVRRRRPGDALPRGARRAARRWRPCPTGTTCSGSRRAETIAAIERFSTPRRRAPPSSAPGPGLAFV